MKYMKFLGVASAVLMLVIVTLVLASGRKANSKRCINSCAARTEPAWSLVDSEPGRRTSRACLTKNRIDKGRGNPGRLDGNRLHGSATKSITVVVCWICVDALSSERRSSRLAEDCSGAVLRQQNRKTMCACNLR
jgi:hypothetical protein